MGSRSVIGRQIADYRAEHEHEILAEFCELLRHRNVATNRQDIASNAEAVSDALRRRGFDVQLLDDGSDCPPCVLGELTVPGATRTVVFYAHYDGQPADQPGWTTDPWTPTVRSGSTAAGAADVDWQQARTVDPEWRIYARSASDDKAPVQAMLSALDALRCTGNAPIVNIKVLYEGEEEQGSPHLSGILSRHREAIAGDLFVLSDGPQHPSGRFQLFFGVRGMTGLELTVYGPTRPLHSGHFGNWAPNPAIMLVHLLAALRDDDGAVLIPGFTADVRDLTGAERAALTALPGTDRAIAAELALGRTEGQDSLAASISRPALNLRGIEVGAVGERAANTIDTRARASIDFRLVPDQTPDRIRDCTERYLADLGWTVVAADPDTATLAAHPRLVKAEWQSGYPAYRAGFDSPPVCALIESVTRAIGVEPLLVPMLGGSLPLHTIAATLAMPVVGMPIANYDNNQHGANENLRIGNLWAAIDLYAQLLVDLSW
jgi:acetylornithine deacetylase/succinyl-diaminopimelate desuccinylase-like protein